MADYSVKYRMVDGSVIAQTVYGYFKGLRALADDITAYGFVTHMNKNEDHATIINNQHVLSVEVEQL